MISLQLLKSDNYFNHKFELTKPKRVFCVFATKRFTFDLHLNQINFDYAAFIKTQARKIPCEDVILFIRIHMNRYMRSYYLQYVWFCFSNVIRSFVLSLSVIIWIWTPRQFRVVPNIYIINRFTEELGGGRVLEFSVVDLYNMNSHTHYFNKHTSSRRVNLHMMVGLIYVYIYICLLCTC